MVPHSSLKAEKKSPTNNNNDRKSILSETSMLNLPKTKLEEKKIPHLNVQYVFPRKERMFLDIKQVNLPVNNKKITNLKLKQSKPDVTQSVNATNSSPVPRCKTSYGPSSASTRSTTTLVSTWPALALVNTGLPPRGRTGSHISWCCRMKLTTSSGKSLVDLWRAS